ncbi:unnamed protein product, partial [Discosporangium mesarthrocarpum]
SATAGIEVEDEEWSWQGFRDEVSELLRGLGCRSLWMGCHGHWLGGAQEILDGTGRRNRPKAKPPRVKPPNPNPISSPCCQDDSHDSKLGPDLERGYLGAGGTG